MVKILGYAPLVILVIFNVLLTKAIFENAKARKSGVVLQPEFKRVRQSKRKAA